MENIFEKVKQFIIKERWEYDFELTLDTSLQDDLKIIGDDASEILVKFCEEFNISHDLFDFNDYFKPEPSWTDFFAANKTYKPFTIGDLIKAVEEGILK